MPIPDAGALACAARDDDDERAPRSPAALFQRAGGTGVRLSSLLSVFGGGASDNRVLHPVVPDRHAACIRGLPWCGRLRQAPALLGGKRRAGHNRKLGA